MSVATETAVGASAPTPVTEVVAAVLLRETLGGTEFLLAQRPAGKVYAGYWEFPGGKIEPGESARAALRRELQEELSIDIVDPQPWLAREFCYPHATVRLKFFRVTAWHGTIAPIEHSAFSWQRIGDAANVTPIQPANGPILRALELPPLYALTHAESAGRAHELARMQQALTNGLRLLQVRDKTLPPDERRDFAAAVLRLAGNYPATRVLINDDEALARAVGAHGLHLSAKSLWQSTARPALPWVGASCHSAADLARAAELAVDFVVLGPLLPTASHPGAPGIGWQCFAELIERSPLPVYALGGMQVSLLATAQRHGAHGVAMLRGWG